MEAHIASVLSWRRPADPRGDLRRRARALLLQRIEALFARAAPPQAWVDFQAGYQALSPAGRRRLLSEPELWGRILQDLESDVGPFLDHLAAAGRRSPFSVLRGARIDATSPAAIARIPHVIERYEPWSEAELRVVVARLREAARLLPHLCQNAHLLVRAFARVVVVRLDPDQPERFLSESTEGVIGRVLLCNPHLSSVGTLDLVEALVHESVHAYLTSVELFCPFIPDRSAAADLLITSPWTGNRLDAQRLTHAILVWFSLAHLWRRVLVQPAVELPQVGRDAAMARMRAANAGFDELERVLPAIRPVLSEGARSLLSGLAVAR